MRSIPCNQRPDAKHPFVPKEEAKPPFVPKEEAKPPFIPNMVRSTFYTQRRGEASLYH